MRECSQAEIITACSLGQVQHQLLAFEKTSQITPMNDQPLPFFAEPVLLDGSMAFLTQPRRVGWQ